MSILNVIDTKHLPSDESFDSSSENLGGLLDGGKFVWIANGRKLSIYSKEYDYNLKISRLFCDHQDNSKITFVKELKSDMETRHLILVGCSFKNQVLLYVCQATCLNIICCITLPFLISCIMIVDNECLVNNQLSDKFKLMSIILFVGTTTGAVYAIDLRQAHIENQLRKNEIYVNEFKPNTLLLVKKQENDRQFKEMRDYYSNKHLAMFINENFYLYNQNKIGDNKLNVSSLLFIKEINAIAIGYSTGIFQLWDCNKMYTIYTFQEPKFITPVSNFVFLESPENSVLYYLWFIQSNNLSFPTATMVALTYKTVIPNDPSVCKNFEKCTIMHELTIRGRTGVGKCISALSMTTSKQFIDLTDVNEDRKITLFVMVMELHENVNAVSETFMFLFDIDQWLKSHDLPSINSFEESNSYTSFKKLPVKGSYLDFKIINLPSRLSSYNFRNIKELDYPSSVYFKFNCLVDLNILYFEHFGVQRGILEQLDLKSLTLLNYPNYIFSECLKYNLKPFFLPEHEDYSNYSEKDKIDFILSILIENKKLTVLCYCAENWDRKINDYSVFQLIRSVYKHANAVIEFTKRLCVPLFDGSPIQLDKKYDRLLNHCLSQLKFVYYFADNLCSVNSNRIVKSDYSYHLKFLYSVIQYLQAIQHFIYLGFLPEYQTKSSCLLYQNKKCDFNLLIKYAIKRRSEFRGSILYLIDAIIYHENNNNISVKQWLDEEGVATRGMYPPSNIQSVLRTHMNPEFSDQAKKIIIVYFLIDALSQHNYHEKRLRMCINNFSFEYENNEIYALCRLSWLLDHDRFEEAMVIANTNEYAEIKKSWYWFHWIVLNLLLTKDQYYWSLYYINLLDINEFLIKTDDKKFYLNLLIQNQNYYGALDYLCKRPETEKHYLFEYCLDQFKIGCKLKYILKYSWDSVDEEKFFSYLKKFNDTETLLLQFLFLIIKGRYVPASILLKKMLKIDQLTYSDLLPDLYIMIHSLNKNVLENICQRLKLSIKAFYKKNNVLKIGFECMPPELEIENIFDEEIEDEIAINHSKSDVENSALTIELPFDVHQQVSLEESEESVSSNVSNLFSSNDDLYEILSVENMEVSDNESFYNFNIDEINESKNETAIQHASVNLLNDGSKKDSLNSNIVTVITPGLNDGLQNIESENMNLSETNLVMESNELDINGGNTITDAKLLKLSEKQKKVILLNNAISENNMHLNESDKCVDIVKSDDTFIQTCSLPVFLDAEEGTSSSSSDPPQFGTNDTENLIKTSRFLSSNFEKSVLSNDFDKNSFDYPKKSCDDMINLKTKENIENTIVEEKALNCSQMFEKKSEVHGENEQCLIFEKDDSLLCNKNKPCSLELDFDNEVNINKKTDAVTKNKIREEFTLKSIASTVVIENSTKMSKRTNLKKTKRSSLNLNSPQDSVIKKKSKLIESNQAVTLFTSNERPKRKCFTEAVKKIADISSFENNCDITDTVNITTKKFSKNDLKFESNSKASKLNTKKSYGHMSSTAKKIKAPIFLNCSVVLENFEVALSGDDLPYGLTQAAKDKLIYKLSCQKQNKKFGDSTSKNIVSLMGKPTAANNKSDENAQIKKQNYQP